MLTPSSCKDIELENKNRRYKETRIIAREEDLGIRKRKSHAANSLEENRTRSTKVKR